MKSLFDFSEFFKNYNKIMMSSIIAAFPLLLPFPRTNNYYIILINYRWDGELMFERGLRPLSNYFPSPAAELRHI